MFFKIIKFHLIITPSTTLNNPLFLFVFFNLQKKTPLFQLFSLSISIPKAFTLSKPSQTHKPKTKSLSFFNFFTIFIFNFSPNSQSSTHQCGGSGVNQRSGFAILPLLLPLLPPLSHFPLSKIFSTFAPTIPLHPPKSPPFSIAFVSPPQSSAPFLRLVLSPTPNPPHRHSSDMKPKSFPHLLVKQHRSNYRNRNVKSPRR